MTARREAISGLLGSRALKAKRAIVKRVRPRYRVATSRLRVLPGFVILGAQRAGTTSVFDYLERHPDIVGPAGWDPSVPWRKELHFFTDRFDRGPDWYRASFPLLAEQRVARLRGGDIVAGEATPYYLFHPAVPERMAATIPDVRLIVLLRNPVERAYSHYQHSRRLNVEPLSFEEALKAEDERLSGEEERLVSDPGYSSQAHRHFSYLSRGRYADQLERWLAYFPRERILILRSEDLFAEPARCYAELLGFLGVRGWAPTEFAARNRASYAPIDPALRARLEDHFAEPNTRLTQLLGDGFAWGSPLSPGQGTSRSASAEPYGQPAGPSVPTHTRS